MPPAASVVAHGDRVPVKVMPAMVQQPQPPPGVVMTTAPEAFAKDAIIAWFRGEFAAANAIIDALCKHLRQLEGGVPAEYESLFGAIHCRRLNWIPILQMQQYYSIADVTKELQKVEAKKSEERQVDEKKIEEVNGTFSEKSLESSVEELEEGNENGGVEPAVEDFTQDDSRESEITDTGSQEVQPFLEHVDICSNHEECEVRHEQIKMTKGFLAKEPVKGHMVNVVRGLKLYEDIFTDVELSKLNDFVNELRVAGQNGELSGETFILYNQQVKGKKRELIQLGIPIFGQIKDDAKGNIEPIPALLQGVINHLIQWHLISENRKPNSCIINFFDEGEYSQPFLKPPHLDQPVSTLILSESAMAFGRTIVSDNEGNYKGPLMLSLKEGSLLVMRGNSSDTARHVMSSSPNKRVTITFFRVRMETQNTEVTPSTGAMTLWQSDVQTPYAVSNGTISPYKAMDMIPKWDILGAPMVMLSPMRPMILSPRRIPQGGTGVFLPWTVGSRKPAKHLPPRAQKGRCLALPSRVEMQKTQRTSDPGSNHEGKSLKGMSILSLQAFVKDNRKSSIRPSRADGSSAASEILVEFRHIGGQENWETRVDDYGSSIHVPKKDASSLMDEQRKGNSASFRAVEKFDEKTRDNGLQEQGRSQERSPVSHEREAVGTKGQKNGFRSKDSTNPLVEGTKLNPQTVNTCWRVRQGLTPHLVGENSIYIKDSVQHLHSERERRACLFPTLTAPFQFITLLGSGMGANGNVRGNGEGSSNVSATEKRSRNKRKFLSDLALDNPIDVSTFSLTEFPRYELLEEKFRNALSGLGSLVSRSEKIVEELEVEEFQPSDWDDPYTCQLEKLLTSNLLATFHSAVKKIVECGYNEETAERVILNWGIYHGHKDAVSNVVDGVLALLKREKEFNFPRLPVFQDLQSLAEYTMLEMIHVILEVKPSLTIIEAMWHLLLCDLNLLNACAVEQDSLGCIGGICGPEVLGGNSESSFPESKPDLSDTNHSNTNKAHNLKQPIQSSQPKSLTAGAVSRLPNSKISLPSEVAKPKKGSSSSFQDARGKFSGITREHSQTSSQATVLDEKSGGSRKGSSSNSKRDMLRQKAFNFEKSYKGCVSKGAFKAKVAAWGNMVLDKTLKSQSDSSSIAMKSHPPSSNLVSSVPSNILPVKDTSTLPIKDTRILPHKDTDHALPALDTKSPASSESELSSNTKIDKSGLSSATDYYAAIPYDESLQSYIPRDDKEETLLILVPHKQALEKELQGWTDWTNEKVMQAARKLRKDQGELKTLRQEKEETEKFKKEKQILEENTMKRLSEMEYALSNATGQIEVANSTVHRLGEENSALRKAMEAAKLQALGSATNLQEAMLREQEALKKSKSWDMEKGLFLEQRIKLKHRAAELQNQLEKTKERKDHFKILWRQEEQEKGKAVLRIDSFKMKREEEDALAKAEEDDLKQVAELDVQKCRDGIKKLENMISELRFESEASKIAALKRGIDPGYASTFRGSHGTRFYSFQDNLGAGTVKPERECVMCMTEEISVVFLPCAHQQRRSYCESRCCASQQRLLRFALAAATDAANRAAATRFAAAAARCIKFQPPANRTTTRCLGLD
ncbi:unnamed protein product [Fraxinus pennsylvanica]|uniref:PIR2-like helical domain-containing protein n=1 Tax=Fraxinus pennsylvanica TaxID=56036 RepID=A0AAD2AIA2_9LAMI|nr:unnamed protein product [Fraxinus pennsylvanica]